MTLRTAEQLRAARALLRMKQSEVAEMTGVSEPTIRRLENGAGPLGVHSSTRDKIQESFESAGVVFIDDGQASSGGGPGVRLAGAKKKGE